MTRCSFQMPGNSHERTKALIEISALAEAMAGTKERHQETIAQGSAFLKAANAWDMKRSELPRPMRACQLQWAQDAPMQA